VKLTLVLLVAALLVFLGFAGSAYALPGDPVISPLGYAEGAPIPAAEEGIKVSYSCPTYRISEEVEEVEEELPPVIITNFGSAENYGVVFSTGNALGKEGRLVSAGFDEAGTAEAEAVKGTPNCTSELELPSAPNPAALYQGKVYWQAFRECEGCETGFETGPVRSFVVVPTDEEAELTYEHQVYGGYLTKIDFAGDAGLNGARVALQRWTGSAWETIAAEPGNAFGENTFYVKLGAGHKLLRPLVLGTPGAELGLEAKAKTVRKAKGGFPTGVQTGEWLNAAKKEREEFPVSFHVTAHGTMLRGLKLPLEAICKGPVAALNQTIESQASVKEARIAPDGTVVAHFLTAGATPAVVSLNGSFFDGRFSGLITSSFLGNCLGFREFEAVAAPKQT
jgi:hypothetical protein